MACCDRIGCETFSDAGSDYCKFCTFTREVRLCASAKVQWDLVLLVIDRLRLSSRGNHNSEDASHCERSTSKRHYFLLDRRK